MQTITKSKIAIIVLLNQDAKTWIDENVSISMVDESSFAIDCTFLAELLEGMTDDGLIENQDYEIIEK